MRNLINQYIDEKDWRVKENSNSTYSASALSNYVAESYTADYCLKKIYPAAVSNAHRRGDIHIHDLGHGLMGYCCGWDLSKLLTDGFRGSTSKIESSPAKHLSSLLGQIINFIGVLQSEWAGAMSFSSFDTYIAPFIRYDKLSYKKIKQYLQEFLYSINAVSRWGSQSPFSNVTLDMNIPKDMAKMPVIIGGNPQKECYGEFQKEVNVFNKALFELYLEGDKIGRPFTFPIPTVSLTPDFKWNGKVSELLFKLIT